MPMLYKSDSVLQAETSDSKGPGIVQFKLSGENIFTYPVIFTMFNLQKSEKVQVTETFGENIHLYAFGKAADVLQVSGMVLADTEMNPDLSRTAIFFTNGYDNTVRAFQAAKYGRIITVVGPGGTVFDGMCIGMNISASAQINILVEFTLNLIGVNSIMAYSKAVTKPTTGESRKTSNAPTIEEEVETISAAIKSYLDTQSYNRHMSELGTGVVKY